MNEPRVVAEVGCNHKGDLDLAKEFVRVAHEFCKVRCVKFQKRCIRESLTPAEYEAPHPNPENAYGETYGAHREALEFSLDQHRELKWTCDELGIIYGCSVWDMTSARQIVSLRPGFLKIPSALNTREELLTYLCEAHDGEIHISLGMTTREEEKKIIQQLASHGRLADVVLYHCTSGYPVPYEQTCLLEIRRLAEAYGARVAGIGFSAHYSGICLDPAAQALGATWIERHFTLDRTWRGTDQAASLEPDGLRRVQRDLQQTYLALRPKDGGLLPIEVEQRRKLKWDRLQAPAVATAVPQAGPPPIRLVVADVDGVLTDCGMYYAEGGEELKRFNTRDGHGFALLREAGVATALLTRENTEMVARRAAKMKVDFVVQGSMDKLADFRDLLARAGVLATEACYIGDDVFDLPVLESGCFAAAPADAVAACRAAADYVCHARGGQGCLRELAERVLERNRAHLSAPGDPA